MDYTHNDKHIEYDSDWDELEEMLEKWVTEASLTFEQRQSLIPIRDFIFDRTHTGRIANA